MSSLTSAELVDALKWRYATKVFDPTKVIPAETWSDLEQSLILTPSSYGMQPWKFIIVQDPVIKEELLEHSWRQRQVVDCSHLVVMVIKTSVSEADIDFYLQRIAEVRGGTADALAGFRKLLVRDLIDSPPADWIGEWAARQSYIALGQFMTAAALLGIDTCPMEGFVQPQYDRILGLEGRGLTTAVLCPAGYRMADDRYAFLPKVRFETKDVIEHRF